MKYSLISPLNAAVLAVLVVAPLGVAAQETQTVQAISAKALRAAQIARTGPQKAIGSLAAPGDQIVLSTRTYCFDASGKKVTCPDKITIREN